MTVIDEVILEREHQDVLWGEQNHTPEKWVAILGEEYGEVCKAVCENMFDGTSLDDMRAEAIQVAAVAVAIVECLDRYNAQPWHRKLGYFK